MKTFNLNLLVSLSFMFIFSFCSKNENPLPEDESLNLLESYTIQKDDSGKYLVDFVLNGNVEIDNVKDFNTNINQFYLYASDKDSSRRVSQNLTFKDGSQIKVGFVDTNSDQKDIITIEDNNSSLSKSKSNSEKKLKNFTIYKKSSNKYLLTYTIHKGFDQKIVYNGDDKEYKILLSTSGKSSETTHTKLLTKSPEELLKICFFNNHTVQSLKKPNVPVVIIE